VGNRLRQINPDKTERVVRRLFQLIFLVALAMPTAISAQEQAGSIFDEGQEHFYSAEYEKAAERFTRYIQMEPDDPRGYWRKAYALYFEWKRDQHRMFPKLNESERKDFYQLVATGIAQADAQIAAKKDVDFALYVKACLLSMRGGVEAGMGPLSLLTARDILKQTLQVASKSNYQDAKYLEGLTNYNGSFHSFWFRVAGLPHDRDLGLKKIFEAYAGNNNRFADDVAFVLVNIETDPRNAKRFTQEDVRKISCPLLAKYPRNQLLKKCCATLCATYQGNL
jgi:tetratricopeptide (TPR) repeat protein